MYRAKTGFFHQRYTAGFLYTDSLNIVPLDYLNHLEKTKTQTIKKIFM